MMADVVFSVQRDTIADLGRQAEQRCVSIVTTEPASAILPDTLHAIGKTTRKQHVSRMRELLQ
ncbi:hypothetical protein GS397_22875 [Sphingobium yanoikuyae]|uniref:Uncharacterized protein n=1 Tax=Sphingobium yanoikuyae TaxID=13690 RepID=A0A6P1GMW8_SPHYA|nr:hypothetical protein [Sphingobium yanoikuyae]QHD69603.1 hypothetical protein GS397_22875 [Sphingobium yanoikuyae]